MKNLGLAVSVMFIGQCLLLPLFAQKTFTEVVSDRPTLGVKVLSDTHGEDLNPYMKTLISDLRSRWRAESGTGWSAHQAGKSIVTLTIDSDGQVSAMYLERSGQVNLDRAAWTVTKLERYPPLPQAFRNSDLKLRITFFPK